jgi:hypothetical protein
MAIMFVTIPISINLRIKTMRSSSLNINPKINTSSGTIKQIASATSAEARTIETTASSSFLSSFLGDFFTASNLSR